MPPVEDARLAARRLLQTSAQGTVRITAHASGDGVAGAAILARALARQGRPFHVAFERHAGARLAAEPDEGDVEVFLGLGAPDWTDGIPLGRTVILIDAVPGPWPREARGLVAFNPVHGGESAGAACASTAAFAVALALDEANWDLAPLALTGVIARRRAFAGWTATVRSESVRRGLVEEDTRLDFDDDALLDVLAFPPPILAPLGRGYDHAETFLRRHALPPDATVHELDEPARQRLASSLVLALLRARAPPADMARLASSHLLMPGANASLTRMATWLDAGAREGEGGIALSYALGDAEARMILEGIEAKARQRRRTVLQRMSLPSGDEVCTIEAQAPADVAPLANLLAARLPASQQIVVVYAGEGSNVRASVRRNSEGPDVGALTRVAAQGAGGHGGGRPDAAGAFVPRARFDAFLASLATTRMEAA